MALQLRWTGDTPWVWDDETGIEEDLLQPVARSAKRLILTLVALLALIALAAASGLVIHATHKAGVAS